MSTPTAVYRFFGAGDLLLYVGLTGDLDERFGGHEKKAPWWPDMKRHEAEWYQSREEAHAVEIAAIESEHPLWNSTGRSAGRPPTGKTPVRNFRMPDLLWDDAAGIAAARGETMTAVIERALQRYVARHRVTRTAEADSQE